MVIIRTHASAEIGIGHLARCRRLANRLQKIGYEVHFLLDQFDEQIQKYLSPFSCQSIYKRGERFADEERDAAKLLQLVESSNGVDAIIVDDYRLGVAWEEKVAKLGARLIVIDDLERNHLCDLLIDSRWEGEKTKVRYQEKLPAHAFKLLGPQYLLMDEVFSSGKATLDRKGAKESVVKFLFSLGGGGDLTLLVQLMGELLKQQPEGFKFQLRPIIGPFSQRRDHLIDFAAQHPEISPIENQNCLYEALVETDIFIGAAGGTLFEALALNIPSLSFSLSMNQQNVREDLEALGHYFHLDLVSESDFPEMTALIWEMVQNLERLKKLYRLPARMPIDGQGVRRVADQIDRLIQRSPLSQAEEVLLPCVISQEKIQLLLVDDRSINRYLQARNLEENLQNMTDQQPVSFLSHYIWWLKSNRRESYELRKNGLVLLYIWHQLVTIKSEIVLIGGWFTADPNCSPIDAMAALGKQLEITDRVYPGVSWVAVIHRNNHFVQKMNRRFGFSQIESNDPLFLTAQSCFPKSTEQAFLYYARRP